MLFVLRAWFISPGCSNKMRKRDVVPCVGSNIIDWRGEILHLGSCFSNFLFVAAVVIGRADWRNSSDISKEKPQRWLHTSGAEWSCWLPSRKFLLLTSAAGPQSGGSLEHVGITVSKTCAKFDEKCHKRVGICPKKTVTHVCPSGISQDQCAVNSLTTG